MHNAGNSYRATYFIMKIWSAYYADNFCQITWQSIKPLLANLLQTKCKRRIGDSTLFGRGAGQLEHIKFNVGVIWLRISSSNTYMSNTHISIWYWCSICATAPLVNQLMCASNESIYQDVCARSGCQGEGSVGCNKLSLPLIPPSGTQALIVCANGLHPRYHIIYWWSYIMWNVVLT